MLFIKTNLNVHLSRTFSLDDGSLFQHHSVTSWYVLYFELLLGTRKAMCMLFSNVIVMQYGVFLFDKMARLTR